MHVKAEWGEAVAQSESKGRAFAGQRCRRVARGAAGLLVAVGMVAAAAPASAIVRLDDGGDVPFYARITTMGDPQQIFHDDTWAVIPFYRPIDCVRKAKALPTSPEGTFNLLDFFHFPTVDEKGNIIDPGAFGCNPPTTGGFNLWHNGPGIDPAPFLAVTHGLGAVPVLFVDWGELELAVADGVLTMGEVEGLRHMWGSADYFHQVLEPHGAAVVPKTLFVARGSLEDGRSFHVRGLHVEGSTMRTSIHIR